MPLLLENKEETFSFTDFEIFIKSFVQMKPHKNIVKEIMSLNLNKTLNFENMFSSPDADKTYLIYFNEKFKLNIQEFNKNIKIPENTILSQNLDYTQLFALETINYNNSENYNISPFFSLIQSDNILKNEFIEYLLLNNIDSEKTFENYPTINKYSKSLNVELLASNLINDESVRIYSYSYLKTLFRLYIARVNHNV